MVLVLGCAVACESRQPDDTAKAVILFLDRSASTEADRSLYAQACERIFSALQPGDRIVAGWITESTAADFRSYIDEELPAQIPPMGIADVQLQYKKKQQVWEHDYQSRREVIRRKLEDLSSWNSTSARTKIFESVRVAAQVFASEQRPTKFLILVSDMIEDSDVANFERARLDDSFIVGEIARQRDAGILPDLSGVRVFAAGASAETMQRAAAVERFWREYFASTGASMGPGDYSRALPEFDE